LDHIGLLLRHLEVGFYVARTARELFLGANSFLGGFALLQNALGLFLVLPEVGLRGFQFELLEQFALAGNVKDNSARAPCVRSAPESGDAGLR
jgi:hypothetical protein